MLWRRVVSVWIWQLQIESCVVHQIGIINPAEKRRRCTERARKSALMFSHSRSFFSSNFSILSPAQHSGQYQPQGLSLITLLSLIPRFITSESLQGVIRKSTWRSPRAVMRHKRRAIFDVLEISKSIWKSTVRSGVSFESQLRCFP